MVWGVRAGFGGFGSVLVEFILVVSPPPPPPVGAMRQPPHACHGRGRHPRCGARPPTLARDMRAELGRGRVGRVTRVRATGAHAGVGETEALCNGSTMQPFKPKLGKTPT